MEEIQYEPLPYYENVSLKWIITLLQAEKAVSGVTQYLLHIRKYLNAGIIILCVGSVKLSLSIYKMKEVSF